MKKGIHPKHVMATVTCACGNTFKVGSVKSEYKVEICSACHPYFTGQQRFVDTAGRIDKFRQRYAKNEEKKADK
ncbi:50S ribosomal protein L31 [Candidatus Sumerlaeota bacterium]|nr:50S ribosomal protein L31 [Candidatus Sumerlaeales bacterium]NLD60832.1 50S ribosomal protein L31 [Candidatus Sumerlaeota bacterium]